MPHHALVLIFSVDFCSDNHNLSPEEKAALIASTKSPISFLSKLGQSIAISRKRNPKVNVWEMLVSIPLILFALPKNSTSSCNCSSSNNVSCHDASSTGQKGEGCWRFGEEKENQPVWRCEYFWWQSISDVELLISFLSSWSNHNKRIDTTFNSFSTFSKEEASRGGRDDRPSVPAILTERKMDSSAVGNHNKVKVMATQLLAKFEENAPAQNTGLKRQVGGSHVVLC